MITVFIDTNIYQELGFNFNCKNEIIVNFIKQIENKEVKNVIISVIDNEVKDHLIKRKKENEIKIKRHCKWIRDYIDEKDIEKNLDRELKSFEDYKKLTKAEIFKIDTVNPENVLKKYFKKEYPFENSKPNEFKDAFFIEGIKKYLENNYSTRNVIITKDKGIKEAVKELQHIEVLSSIQELTDLIIDYGKERKEEIWEYLKGYDLNPKLESIYPIVEENDLEEGNIEIEEIINTGVYGVEIIKATLDKITIVCNLGICLKGSFSCLDIENSVYDSEEKEYIYKSYLKRDEMLYVCLTILDIEVKNNKLSEVIIKDFPDIDINYEDLQNK